MSQSKLDQISYACGYLLLTPSEPYFSRGNDFRNLLLRISGQDFYKGFLRVILRSLLAKIISKKFNYKPKVLACSQKVILIALKKIFLGFLKHI